MTRDEFENLQAKMGHVYLTEFSDDAKLIIEAVEKGKAVSMYYELIGSAVDNSLSPKEKLLPVMRFYFFLECCLKTNNGIPMIEIVSDWIDNSHKRKVVNAANSQIILFDFLIEKGTSINILADYIEERDIIECATGEEKKSTRVLKKILNRKRAALNNTELQDYSKAKSTTPQTNNRDISASVYGVTTSSNHTFESGSNKGSIELKPTINTENANVVFDILKYHFDQTDHDELLSVLKTGNNSSKKLLFKGQGNRLTDTFKQLYEHNLMTGCEKQHLISWIADNFTFLKRGEQAYFNIQTVEKNISGNQYACKTPLIKVENGEIFKTTESRKKNYNNY